MPHLWSAFEIACGVMSGATAAGAFSAPCAQALTLNAWLLHDAFARLLISIIIRVDKDCVRVMTRKATQSLA